MALFGPGTPEDPDGPSPEEPARTEPYDDDDRAAWWVQPPRGPHFPDPHFTR